VREHVRLVKALHARIPEFATVLLLPAKRHCPYGMPDIIPRLASGVRSSVDGSGTQDEKNESVKTKQNIFNFTMIHSSRVQREGGSAGSMNAVYPSDALRPVISLARLSGFDPGFLSHVRLRPCQILGTPVS